jgi:hypothetical protein
MTNVPQSSLAPIVLLEDDRCVVVFVRRALERAGITNPIVNFATAEEGRHYIEELGSIYFLRKPITEQELTAAVEALRLAGTGLAGAVPQRER